MKIYKPHPAALVMPPMRPEDMDALKRSILDRGQVHPAVLIDGKLLDGRNRQEAIRQLVAEKKLAPSTELKVTEWTGRGGTEAGYVDATNDKRRHLTAGQRAMIATRLLPFFRKEAKERQREAARATNRNKKQPELIKSVRGKGRRASEKAAEKAGAGVSARDVERAAFVLKKDAALAKLVFAGDRSIKQAEQTIRRREQKQKASEYVLPAGQFQVIVADPPWEFDDELNGSMNRGLPYPTMPLEQICAMDVADLAAPDCALFLWTTKSHLLDGSAAKVCAAWGFAPRSMITWVKSNVGLGRYVRNRCEFVIIAVRGQPFFDLEGAVDLKDDVMIQTGPRLEHSEKPAEIFARIEALCPVAGPHARIELFARNQSRSGWVTSGSELAREARDGDSVSAQPVGLQNSAASPAPQVEVPTFSPSGGLGTAHDAMAFPAPDAASLAPVPADDLPF